MSHEARFASCEEINGSIQATLGRCATKIYIDWPKLPDRVHQAMRETKKAAKVLDAYIGLSPDERAASAGIDFFPSDHLRVDLDPRPGTRDEHFDQSLQLVLAAIPTIRMQTEGTRDRRSRIWELHRPTADPEVDLVIEIRRDVIKHDGTPPRVTYGIDHHVLSPPGFLPDDEPPLTPIAD